MIKKIIYCVLPILFFLNTSSGCAEPSRVHGWFLGLQGTRQVGNIDAKIKVTDTTISLGERDWGLGADFGYNWVMKRFVLGLYVDGHYRLGGGWELSLDIKDPSNSSLLKVAFKHKRFWDSSLGMRFGYDGGAFCPYALTGLRVCMDSIEFKGAAGSALRGKNDQAIPEVLWEWGGGIEVFLHEGWYIGVEAAFGHSFLWVKVSKNALDAVEASLRFRAGYHF